MPYLLGDFRNYWIKRKSGLKCGHPKNKAQTRNNNVPKRDKPSGKSFSKGIQCFECQGYGHIAAECANRKEKRLSKALNITWDNDSENENCEPKSPTQGPRKFIAFMAKYLDIFSEQGSSDRDSKSDEDLSLNGFADEEHDLEVSYMKLLKDSIRLIMTNDRMTLKLKSMESQNSSLKVELDHTRAKVSQLETHHSILLNNCVRQVSIPVCSQSKRRKLKKNWK